MNANIRIRDSYNECDECCECGNPAVAVIETTNVKLYLCNGCLKEFQQATLDVSSRVESSCYKCKYYMPHPDGYRYCGRCQLTEVDKSYWDGSTGWLDTCKEFVAK